MTGLEIDRTHNGVTLDKIAVNAINHLSGADICANARVCTKGAKISAVLYMAKYIQKISAPLFQIQECL